MSTLLTLLVVCCAARGVSSATTPLRFMVDYNHHEPLDDTPPPAALSEPIRKSEGRRSISFGFFDTVAEQPDAELSFDAVRFPGEESRDGGSGGLAGEGGSGDPGEVIFSGDAAPDAVRFPTASNRDKTPIEPTRNCVHDNMTILYEGTLWKLLSGDQCLEREWVVMVAECLPQCRLRPCPVGQLEYRGRCVNPTDRTVCSGGQILYLDQRGSTFCDCEENHLYSPLSGQCYGRRERGRCDFGFFLDINKNGDVECMPNECKVDELEKDTKSGKCFRKDFVGYCPVESLEFHYNNETVSCWELDLRNVFDRAITRSCGTGSRIGHHGHCRQEVVIPSITSRPRSLTGGCRTGAIKIGAGPCRRVNYY